MINVSSCSLASAGGLFMVCLFAQMIKLKGKETSKKVKMKDRSDNMITHDDV